MKIKHIILYFFTFSVFLIHGIRAYFYDQIDIYLTLIITIVNLFLLWFLFELPRWADKDSELSKLLNRKI